MATALTLVGDDPPLGDPPYDNNGHHINGNERTIPMWMDRLGLHGERIILQMSAADETSSLPNAFIVGRSIEAAVGGKIESAKTEDKRTKYALITRSIQQAKQLISMKKLADGTEVVVELHPTRSKCRCVVSCPEVIDMTENELLAELKNQGIVEVRRIFRPEGTKKVNTPTLILTIGRSVAPKHVFFGPLRIPTRLYYPNPMICYKCCKYGHTKNKCTNVAACKNCSGVHPEGAEDCDQQPFCKNCQGNHQPISKKCLQYVKEQKIIKIQVESGMTFPEARREYEKLNGENSYAGVSGAQDRLDQIRRDNEVQMLKAEIIKLKEAAKETEKDREILRLRQELEQMRTIVAEFQKMKKELNEMKASRALAEQRIEISEDEENSNMIQDDQLQEDQEQHVTPCKEINNDENNEAANRRRSDRKKKDQEGTAIRSRSSSRINRTRQNREVARAEGDQQRSRRDRHAKQQNV